MRIAAASDVIESQAVYQEIRAEVRLPMVPYRDPDLEPKAGDLRPRLNREHQT